MQTKEVKISRPSKENPPLSLSLPLPPPQLSVSSTMATDGDKPGGLSVTCTGSSNRWSEEAVYCLLPSAFYLTDCTSDASRSSDICELRGSGRQFADVCEIFRVKVALVIVALRCLPSRANTERSWGGSACRTMSACLQVFTYPSRRPSPLHLHTEAVQTCHTCS